MTPEEVHRLVTLAGYNARIRGDEVRVETCWYCGNDRWNLELNGPKGVISCWACREGGRLDASLSQRLGRDVTVPVRLGEDGTSPSRGPAGPADLLTRAVRDVPSADAWLARRGVTADEAEARGIRVCVEPEPHEMRGRILLPLLCFWTGAVLGHQGRAYVPGARPKYRTTAPRQVLSGHRTRAPRPCAVVEGPFDGLAVARAGLQAAVLGGTDSPHEEELAARLPPEVPLVVLLDGEAEEESRRLWHRLRTVRPSTERRVLPPGVDPGELRPEVLRKLLSQRS